MAGLLVKVHLEVFSFTNGRKPKPVYRKKPNVPKGERVVTIRRNREVQVLRKILQNVLHVEDMVTLLMIAK